MDKIKEEEQAPIEETTDVAPNEEVTTLDTTEEVTEQKPTAQERARGILKERYPDREFGEDIDLMDALLEVVEEDSGYRTKANEVNQKLVDLFEAEPVLFNIVQDALNGAPGHVAIARNIDPEDFEAARADESTGDWDENIKSRKEKLSAQKKAREESEANLQKSLATAEEFTAEKGMSEEEADEFIKVVDAALEPIYKGIVTKDYLENIYKAMNFDSALNEAKSLGEAKARNEKIVTEKDKGGDGLPKLDSSTIKEETSKPMGYIDKLKKRS